MSFYRGDYLQIVSACLLWSCEEAGVLLFIFGSRFDGPFSQMFLMAPHFKLSSISDVLHQSLHPTICKVCLHILPDSKSYPQLLVLCSEHSKPSLTMGWVLVQNNTFQKVLLTIWNYHHSVEPTVITSCIPWLPCKFSTWFHTSLCS